MRFVAVDRFVLIEPVPTTRFVVDASAVIHLASEQIEVGAAHELLAPTLLRSQGCRCCTRPSLGGEIPSDVGRDRIARIAQIKARYLGAGPAYRSFAEISQSPPRSERPGLLRQISGTRAGQFGIHY